MRLMLERYHEEWVNGEEGERGGIEVEQRYQQLIDRVIIRVLPGAKEYLSYKLEMKVKVSLRKCEYCQQVIETGTW